MRTELEFRDGLLLEEGKPENREKKPRSKARTHPTIWHRAGIKPRPHLWGGRPLSPLHLPSYPLTTKLINPSTDRAAFYLTQKGTVNKPNNHVVAINPFQCKVYAEAERFFVKLPGKKKITVHNYLRSWKFT